MNKLKQIYDGWRLNNVKKALMTNAKRIELYIESKSGKFEDYVNYKGYYLEQLRLMSCNSYLENKLSEII